MIDGTTNFNMPEFIEALEGLNDAAYSSIINCKNSEVLDKADSKQITQKLLRLTEEIRELSKK